MLLFLLTISVFILTKSYILVLISRVFGGFFMVIILFISLIIALFT